MIAIFDHENSSSFQKLIYNRWKRFVIVKSCECELKERRPSKPSSATLLNLIVKRFNRSGKFVKTGVATRPRGSNFVWIKENSLWESATTVESFRKLPRETKRFRRSHWCKIPSEFPRLYSPSVPKIILIKRSSCSSPSFLGNSFVGYRSVL